MKEGETLDAFTNLFKGVMINSFESHRIGRIKSEESRRSFSQSFLLLRVLVIGVRSPSHVWLFAIPWLQHTRSPCPSPSPEVCPSSCPLHQWFYPAISSSDALFLCPHSVPVSGTFPKNWLFTSGDQNTEASASASVLPISIQGWFPLRLTDLNSLLSKGLSRVFSSTAIRRHQFFGALFSLQSSSHNHMWPLGRS